MMERGECVVTEVRLGGRLTLVVGNWHFERFGQQLFNPLLLKESQSGIVTPFAPQRKHS